MTASMKLKDASSLKGKLWQTCVLCCAWLLSCVRLFATPWTAAPPSRLLCPWDSLGKNTGVGCHALLHPGIEPRSPTPQVDSLSSESPGKPDDKPSILKQRHHVADKDPHSQSYDFSSSHVQMWELDHKEGWALKNWCFQIVVLEKTLESPLDCKDSKSVNPKGNQSWIFTGRTDAEAEVPILWSPDVKSQLIGKDPDAGKDWRQEEKGAAEDKIVR